MDNQCKFVDAQFIRKPLCTFQIALGGGSYEKRLLNHSQNLELAQRGILLSKSALIAILYNLMMAIGKPVWKSKALIVVHFQIAKAAIKKL